MTKNEKIIFLQLVLQILEYRFVSTEFSSAKKWDIHEYFTNKDNMEAAIEDAKNQCEDFDLILEINEEDKNYIKQNLGVK